MPTPPAPAVSIVIPVLDRLEFTKQCLDRIQRNTGDVPSYEVIIVDNGSSDGTEAWCTEACRAWTRLRYHRNPTNLGFARANNLGAAVARGTHLLFLNNDTLPQPGWLSGMLRVASSGKGQPLCYFHLELQRYTHRTPLALPCLEELIRVPGLQYET